MKNYKKRIDLFSEFENKFQDFIDWVCTLDTW